LAVPQVTDPALATSPEDLMQFTVHSGTSDEAVADETTTTPGETSAFFTSEEAQLEVPASVMEEAEKDLASHSYDYDPMAEINAISSGAQEAAASPELVEEFGKPLIEDENELEDASPTAGLLSALHEYEAASKSDDVAPVEHVGSALPFETVSSVLHPEPQAEASTSAQVESLLERMAAIVPTIPDSAPLNPELAKETTFDNGSSSSAATVPEVPEGSKTMALAAGMETRHVANAVQRVFERYKEKMIADITDELRRSSE
jgi:hypothetical protein